MLVFHVFLARQRKPRTHFMKTHHPYSLEPSKINICCLPFLEKAFLQTRALGLLHKCSQCEESHELKFNKCSAI